VHVFEEVGKSPTVTTNYGFAKKILLCFSPDNHYDSVYPKLYIVKAAFCQCKYYLYIQQTVNMQTKYSSHFLPVTFMVCFLVTSQTMFVIMFYTVISIVKFLISKGLDLV
jgi:hypothetical protein